MGVVEENKHKVMLIKYHHMTKDTIKILKLYLEIIYCYGLFLYVKYILLIILNIGPNYKGDGIKY